MSISLMIVKKNSEEQRNFCECEFSGCRSCTQHNNLLLLNTALLLNGTDVIVITVRIMLWQLHYTHTLHYII